MTRVSSACKSTDRKSTTCIYLRQRNIYVFVEPERRADAYADEPGGTRSGCRPIEVKELFNFI